MITERYDQQDGSDNPSPDKDTGVSDSKDAHPATTGDRSTQENMGGQGLGQIPDDQVAARAGDTGKK